MVPRGAVLSALSQVGDRARDRTGVLRRRPDADLPGRDLPGALGEPRLPSEMNKLIPHATPACQLTAKEPAEVAGGARAGAANALRAYDGAPLAGRRAARRRLEAGVPRPEHQPITS